MHCVQGFTEQSSSASRGDQHSSTSTTWSPERYPLLIAARRQSRSTPDRVVAVELVHADLGGKGEGGSPPRRHRPPVRQVCRPVDGCSCLCVGGTVGHCRRGTPRNPALAARAYDTRAPQPHIPETACPAPGSPPLDSSTPRISHGSWPGGAVFTTISFGPTRRREGRRA